MKKYYSLNHELLFVSDFEGFDEDYFCPYCNSPDCEAVGQGDGVYRTGCGGDISEESKPPYFVNFAYTKTV